MLKQDVLGTLRARLIAVRRLIWRPYRLTDRESSGLALQRVLLSGFLRQSMLIKLPYGLSSGR